MRNVLKVATVVLLVLMVGVTACGKKQPPVARPAPAPPRTGAPPPPAQGGGPQHVEDTLPVPPQPLGEDATADRSLDDLNRDSPFKPVFFALDSSDLDDVGRTTATTNSEVLKKYRPWVVTIEGHCDERGTAEYNLALGERRAVAVKTYLVSLGVAPDRIRVVSYGKEFPFDAGHDESAWSFNRRAHFVITAK